MQYDRSTMDIFAIVTKNPRRLIKARHKLPDVLIFRQLAPVYTT